MNIKTAIPDTNVLILETISKLKPDFNSRDKEVINKFSQISDDLFIPNIITLEFEIVFHRVILKKYKLTPEVKTQMRELFETMKSLFSKYFFVYPMGDKDLKLANEIYDQANFDNYKISLTDASLLAISINFEKLPIFTMDENLKKLAKRYGIPLV